MIYLSIANEKLKKAVSKQLTKLGVAVESEKPSSKSYMGMYQDKVSGIVVDCSHPNLPGNAWLDMLSSVAKRKPVLVLGELPLADNQFNSESIFRLEEPNSEGIISILRESGALGLSRHKKIDQAVKLYDSKIPLKMFKKNDSLSVLCIDAQSFQSIATEYGNKTHSAFMEYFEQNLFTLWGPKGSFRAGDVVCKKSESCSIYYIFLELSRTRHDVPLPGELEKLADRVATGLQHLLWQKNHKESDQIITNNTLLFPVFAVGYASEIGNPCIDTQILIDDLLDSALASTKIQKSRNSARERELLQALIRLDGTIEPHYQAVLDVKNLEPDFVRKAQKSQTLKTYSDHLYGFEALIRVNSKYVNDLLDKEGPIHFDAEYLKPELLFRMAEDANIGLELDQACMKISSKLGAALPGKLLINILPRNLYHIDELKHLFPEDVEIVFELAESEAISNFDLLLSTKKSLAAMNAGIAADDFGKGYASLERVIKIKPDLIKLDRVLIQDIDKDPGKIAYVRGLVDAAKTSKTIILAEGVETLGEFEVCKGLGVDLMQGYLFHRPQSLHNILEVISKIKISDEEPNDSENIAKIGGAA